MPEYILPNREAPAYEALDDFTKGYIQAAFFTSCGPDDGELSEKGFNDLAPETLEKIVADCAIFQSRTRTLLKLACIEKADYSAESAGMDFWYTRQGHGVGFWDRGFVKVGEDLTRHSEKFPSFDLYLGDDGLIYY